MARRPLITLAALLGGLAPLFAAVLAPATLGTPAQAAARVTVANADGDAAVDPAYATTVTVRGRGFQSIRGGHGGIYVMFGTVSSGWRPSQGGRVGGDYFYVPDSQDEGNAGFQKYVAFPGSDTASSANGGTIAADGSWSTTLVVPGAVFQAPDRDGKAHTVDCRKVRCGVITVGAHGVANARNETFTPVTVRGLYGGSTPSPTTGPTAPATALAAAPAAPAAPSGTATQPGQPARAAGPVVLEVDRASARAGHAMPFSATGLAPGAQVAVVLDDGVAAAGPFAVGAAGQLAGVLSLPADAVGGTHELRLYGVPDPPSVRFAIATDRSAPVAAVPTEAGVSRAGLVVVAAAAAALLAVLARLALQRRRPRRG